MISEKLEDKIKSVVIPGGIQRLESDTARRGSPAARGFFSWQSQSRRQGALPKKIPPSGPRC